jgi:glycine cleavage system regulatory protein
MRTLDLFVGDEGNPDRRRVAQVGVLENQMLTLISVEADFSDAVKNAIANFNAAEELFVVIPSAEDSPRYTMAKELVVRGGHNFLDAIRDNFDRYHGLDLVDT